jgi:hypothetical protein
MEVEWRGIVVDEWALCAGGIPGFLFYGRSSCGNLCRGKGGWDADG